MDMNDGYSSEDDYFNNLIVKITALDALDDDNESDTEDGFMIFDGARRCFLGGAGTSRPDRQAPRPFITGVDGESDIRRHFGMDGEWGRIFFIPVVLPGSLAWDDFRLKFRTPLPLFNYILECTKESGKFPFEAPPTGGHEPQPLCLKLAAYLRYLATSVCTCACDFMSMFICLFITDNLCLRQVHKLMRMRRDSGLPVRL